MDGTVFPFSIAYPTVFFQQLENKMRQIYVTIAEKDVKIAKKIDYRRTVAHIWRKCWFINTWTETEIVYSKIRDLPVDQVIIPR